MDAVSSKSKPRKTMRVATVFTGVAAVTVGMTQVANAQDATHAVHKPTTKHIARQIRPAATASSRYGSMEISYACALDYPTPAHPTWLHVWVHSPYGEGGESLWCYGFKGESYSPPGIGIISECAGNNYGILAGSSGAWYVDFKQRNTYAYLGKKHLDVVAISGWAGTDKCGV